MKNLIYTFAFCFSLTMIAKAQRIYQTAESANGAKDVISVMVPDGWVQDNQRKHGIWAKNILVKADEVGEMGNGKIYIQTIPMEADQYSVEDVIAHEKMMYKTVNTEVKETARITLDELNKEVSVISVKGSPDDAHQVVAFIPLTTSVAVVTLSTPYSEFVADHMADFTSLLRSFQLNPHLKQTTGTDVITRVEE
jgi:hypothetical protein